MVFEVSRGGKVMVVETVVHCDAFICKYWERDEDDDNPEHGLCACEEIIIEDGCCAQAVAEWGDKK